MSVCSNMFRLNPTSALHSTGTWLGSRSLCPRMLLLQAGSAWAVSVRAVTSVDILGLNGLNFTRGSCYSCCRGEQGDA